MSLREAARNLLAKQGDPWIPYQGDYGGEGWMNVRTGEVRYQENKPDPGASGETEYGAAETELDPGGQVGEPPDDYGPVDWSLVDEGDMVIVENGDESVAAEIVGDGGDDDWVDVDMGEMGETSMPRSAVLGAPQMPPPDGLADGWVDPPDQRNIGQLQPDQTVEVYDIEEGEYVTGEVVNTDEHADAFNGDYAHIDADGETYEFAPGLDDVEPNAIVTAAEDPDANSVHFIDEWSDLADVEEGNYVQYELDGEVEGGVVEDVMTWTDEPEVKLDNGVILQADIDAQDPQLWQDERPSPWDLDDEYRSLDDAERLSEYFGYEVADYADDDYEDRIEGVLKPPEEAGEMARIDGEVTDHIINEQFDLDYHDLAVKEPDWADPSDAFPTSSVGGDLLSGSIARFDHPLEGRVQGHVDEVTVDSEGNRWFHIGEGESFTDNPDHPSLFVGDTLEQVEDPWTDPDDTDPLEDLKTGDKVQLGEEGVAEVQEVDNKKLKLDTPNVDGEDWYDPDEFKEYAEAVAPQDHVEPPEGYDEWGNAFSVDDDGNVSLASFNPEDTVAYFNDTKGVLETGEVEDHNPDDFDGVVLEDGTEVPRQEMHGYAPTGTPPLPDHNVPADKLSVGAGADLAYINDDDEYVELDGIVTEINGNLLEITDRQGDQHRILRDSDEYAVTSWTSDPDMGEFGIGDGLNTPTEEIVEDLRSRVSLDPQSSATNSPHSTDPTYLSKGPHPKPDDWIAKEQQKDLKSELQQWFDPGEVDAFYDAVDGWKSNSSPSGSTQKLESAFVHALGLESRVRGTKPQEGVPFGEHEIREWTKLVEVATELSRDHYEQHVGEWYRGCSTTAKRSLINAWAEHPDAEEYNFDGRAVNNGDNDPMNTWNSWRIAPGERVDADQIALATDMLFNPFGTHDTEAEIWGIADGMTVKPDEVHLNHNASYNLAGDIDEWSNSQLKGVGMQVAGVYDQLEGDLSTEVHRSELSDQQIETFAKLASEIRKNNLHSTSASLKSFIADVTADAEERGINVAGIGDGAEGFDEVSDFGEGYEITAFSPYDDEPVKATVTDVWPDSGVINAEDDMGNLLELEPEDVESVDWAPDGAHKDPAQYVAGYEDEGLIDVSEGNFDIEDLSYDDTVLYDDGFGIEQGSVYDVDDHAMEVKIEGEGWVDTPDIEGVEESSPAVTHLDVDADGDEPAVPVADGYDLADFEQAVGDWDEEGVEVMYQHPFESGAMYGQVKGVYDDELLIYPDSQTEHEIDPSSVIEIPDEGEMNEALAETFEPGETVEYNGETYTVGGYDGEGMELLDDSNMPVGPVDPTKVEPVDESDGGADDEPMGWQAAWEQASEAHHAAESGTDEYWDTYEDALDALPFDVGDTINAGVEQWTVLDVDPQQDTPVEIHNEATGNDKWVHPEPVVEEMDFVEGPDEAHDYSSGDGAGGVEVEDIEEGDTIEVEGADAVQDLHPNQPVFVNQTEFDGDGFYVSNDPNTDPEDQVYVGPEQVAGVTEFDTDFDFADIDAGDVVQTSYTTNDFEAPVEVVDTHPDSDEVTVETNSGDEMDIPESAIDGVADGTADASYSESTAPDDPNVDPDEIEAGETYIHSDHGELELNPDEMAEGGGETYVEVTEGPDDVNSVNVDDLYHTGMGPDNAPETGVDDDAPSYELGDTEVQEGQTIEITQEYSHPNMDPDSYTGEFQGAYAGAADGDYLLDVDGTDIAFDAEDFDGVAEGESPEADESELDGGILDDMEEEFAGVGSDDSDIPQGEISPEQFDDVPEGTDVTLYAPNIDKTLDGEIVENTETVGGDPALLVEDEHGNTHTLNPASDTEVYIGEDPTAEGSADANDKPDDISDVTDPAAIHAAEPAVGEAVSVEFPNGNVVDAEVVNTPLDDVQAPITIEDENDKSWLIWPDGDLEPA